MVKHQQQQYPKHKSKHFGKKMGMCVSKSKAPESGGDKGPISNWSRDIEGNVKAYENPIDVSEEKTAVNGKSTDSSKIQIWVNEETNYEMMRYSPYTTKDSDLKYDYADHKPRHVLLKDEMDEQGFPSDGEYESIEKMTNTVSPITNELNEKFQKNKRHNHVKDIKKKNSGDKQLAKVVYTKEENASVVGADRVTNSELKPQCKEDEESPYVNCEPLKNKARNPIPQKSDIEEPIDEIQDNELNLPKAGIVVIAKVDQRGNHIVVPDTQIELTIPEGAIKDEMTIFVGLSKQWTTTWPFGLTVTCGPHGTKFLKPLILSFPHFFNFDRKGNRSAILTSDTAEGETDNWQPLAMYQSVVFGDRCFVFTNHFSKFTCCCEKNPKPHEAMSLIVLAYIDELVSGKDVTLRVHVGEKTQEVRGLIKNQESELGGTLADAEKTAIIHNNNKDVCLEVSNTEDWECTDKEDTTVNFSCLWNSSENSFSKTFVLKPKSSIVTAFRTKVTVNQQGTSCDGSSAVININKPIITSNASKDVGEQLTKYYMKEINPEYEVTVKVAEDLHALLTGNHPTGNNWRMVADKLGFSFPDTDMIEKLDPGKPVHSILRFMHHMKIPLETLSDILKSMGRDDAAKVVDEHLDPSKQKGGYVDLYKRAVPSESRD
ncbi:UNC5C-like protein isoform X2 [Glandiceps talaboti]